MAPLVSSQREPVIRPHADIAEFWDGIAVAREWYDRRIHQEGYPNR